MEGGSTVLLGTALQSTDSASWCSSSLWGTVRMSTVRISMWYGNITWNITFHMEYHIFMWYWVGTTLAAALVTPALFVALVPLSGPSNCAWRAGSCAHGAAALLPWNAALLMLQAARGRKWPDSSQDCDWAVGEQLLCKWQAHWNTVFVCLGFQSHGVLQDEILWQMLADVWQLLSRIYHTS